MLNHYLGVDQEVKLIQLLDLSFGVSFLLIIKPANALPVDSCHIC